MLPPGPRADYQIWHVPAAFALSKTSSRGSAIMFSVGKESASADTRWTLWVHRPEQLWFRQLLFQVHLWVGAATAGWVLLMSLTGSVLVFRDQLSALMPMEWIAHLHASLLAGPSGHRVNAPGAVADPADAKRRRDLVARTQALASKPQDRMAHTFRADHMGCAQRTWFLVSSVCWNVECVRALLSGTSITVGVVPAVLAFTGVFICCRRVIFKKPSNPLFAAH